jgi:hypothetical protein
MAYFDSILTAPKVYLESEPSRREPVSFSTNLGLVGKTRQITTSRYEYRGMTRASAESAAASLASATVTAKAERMTDANAWKVSVVEQTIGAWS